ncbi:hypothetical protein SLEP1_g56522 [Rubroshorea leprosula]|uniref:DUF4220 domain-containing protein n=1 Tax=Rubroshorea leprosula TaxID=152421 RepID=A0AAV5MMG9_9ROSI|nr:hypothetical protein SLEP1_g56522 [Rubroshorea leprosula]
MAPVLSIPENVQKLWDTWSIRVFIIISFSVQALLLLLATFRQRIRSWWRKLFIWVLYLFADWVAVSTIGFIVQHKSSTMDGPPSDILAFWAPFLLLHLGGPDSITSYSLEDNKLWQRYLLKLVLQLGFTVYAILTSLSRHELWLATLVLFAGVVKYVERNVALRYASLDHFGEKWEATNATDGIPIPVQFKGVKNNGGILQTAVLLLGSLKSVIIGPAPKEKEQKEITSIFNRGRSRCDAAVALQIIEIELSLLYELLHTKLPVITSAIGFIFRIGSVSCILVALLSFSLVKKHYQLGLVDVLLTYGLLIGTLALDFLSIILFIKCSDWFAATRLQDQYDLPNAFINRRRWCKKVSQLNFLTYHVKDCPGWLKKLDEHCMWSLLEYINIHFRCSYDQNFQDPLWRFIWIELLEKCKETKYRKEQGTWLSKNEFKALLERASEGKSAEKLMDQFIYKFESFSRTLLVWHIGTELCFQDDNDQCRHESEGTDDRSICKLLSDYMFYLAVGVQPSMMATVLDDWKKEFEEICEQTRRLVPWSFFADEKTARKKILCRFKKGKVGNCPLSVAVDLACWLKKEKQEGGYDYSWKLMSTVWVHLMFYAAVTCSSYVHAQQPSQGGELLTFVWLSLNHLGLGRKYKMLKEELEHPLIPPPAPKPPPPPPPPPQPPPPWPYVDEEEHTYRGRLRLEIHMGSL